MFICCRPRILRLPAAGPGSPSQQQMQGWPGMRGDHRVLLLDAYVQVMPAPWLVRGGAVTCTLLPNHAAEPDVAG